MNKAYFLTSEAASDAYDLLAQLGTTPHDRVFVRSRNQYLKHEAEAFFQTWKLFMPDVFFALLTTAVAAALFVSVLETPLSALYGSLAVLYWTIWRPKHINGANYIVIYGNKTYGDAVMPLIPANMPAAFLKQTFTARLDVVGATNEPGDNIGTKFVYHIQECRPYPDWKKPTEFGPGESTMPFPQ